jgi:cytochrome P450
MTSSKRLRFPVGHDVTLSELELDPYPVFARLRAQEPITWLRALNMWYVTGYDDVRTAMLDTVRLTTASERSTIFETFGAHMLTTEGAMHDRYRRAAQFPFAPAFIRAHIESAIEKIATDLVGELAGTHCAELRAAYASRLPIFVILLICGLPATAERQMRRWYDTFEAALANFTGDPAVSAAATHSVVEFHALLDDAIATGGSSDEHSLVTRLVNAPTSERLTNDEIKRNLSIIFFGGISTVEALLLNALWALFENAAVFERVKHDLALIPRVVEETMRWLSPVQSATRHVVQPFEWRGIEFAAHDTVNCMLGAANRDPAVFAEPDRFDIDRLNIRRHLGFATGPHACLGSNLAKAEARIALETLLRRLPGLRLEGSLTKRPTGYEFRQSRKLTVSWNP